MMDVDLDILSSTYKQRRDFEKVEPAQIPKYYEITQ
jgi:hypothetical protein